MKLQFTLALFLGINLNLSAQWTSVDGGKDLKTDQNVGIGLDNPISGSGDGSEKWLSIRGDRRSVLQVGSDDNQSAGSSFGRIDFYHGGSYKQTFASIYAARKTTSRNAQLYFNTRSGDDWATRMIISPNGNVGINTLDPGVYKLAVNGNIRAKEIICETGWSDFVFEENYHLPTLQEVEDHINKHGHLKDIPSAAEVEANGVSLGEMDSKLLQKIEELMLYAIEQDKKIKTYEKEKTSMQKQLNTLQQQVNNLINQE